MNRATQYHHIRPQHLLDDSDRYSSRLIDHKQLSLGQLSIILRLDVLYRLPMVLEHVHSHHCIVEIRVGRLQDVVVCVLTIIKSIQTFEKKLEYGGQVLWTWCSDENVAETIDDGAC